MAALRCAATPGVGVLTGTVAVHRAACRVAMRTFDRQARHDLATSTPTGSEDEVEAPEGSSAER